MTPTLALLLWIVILLALLCFDPAKDTKTSWTLWLPVIWMFIVGSRLPSQWLGGSAGQAAQALEEGDSLDRAVYFALIILAIGILTVRSFNWREFCSRNASLVAFIFFALMSVCWSDFSFVAFKRWFRDLGSYLVVLVALSDRRPLAAVSMVLRRVSYLMVPLSILLIKYFPLLGKQYSYWTGGEMYIGVTTGKNLLGAVCVVSGLFFFWDTAVRWSDRSGWRTRRIIIVNIVFLAMTLWLLKLAHTVTSDVCSLLGCLVIAFSRTRWSRRHPAFLKVLIPTCFCMYMILAFGFDMSGQLASAVGKDPTLTERTRIWSLVWSLHTNPLLGTGYESFWLGPRLQWFWGNSGMGGINESHNGYLETYLNLGLIGLVLLVGFLIASYRNIWRGSNPLASLGSLSLAVWFVFLFYNVTEAGFRSGLMWLTFLLVAIPAPTYVKSRIPKPARLAIESTSSDAPVFHRNSLCELVATMDAESNFR